MKPASSESSRPRNNPAAGGGGGPRPPPRAAGGGRQAWVPKGSPSIIPPHPPVNGREPSHESTSHGRQKQNPSRQTYIPRPASDAPVAAAPSEPPAVPQLVQEIQDKLSRGAVECMICYDMVRRSAAIWSCSACFSIFHLNCIKKWARSPTSTDVSAAETSSCLNWRCPGCQAVQATPSRELQYTCFCRRRRDPPNDFFLTPHSCGEPCGKPLNRDPSSSTGGGDVENEDDDDDDGHRCPHVCVLQCHPGPCPPCKAFAPKHPCPCGKKTIARRCADKKTSLTCGQRCDKRLSCGRHRCEKVCHMGSCDPCRVSIEASCFCKKKTEVLLCGEMTVRGDIKEIGDGVFSCNSACGKVLECGNHSCEEDCHPGPCGECNFLPRKIKTCCCGKTGLEKERGNCLDPIPTCSEICGKLLLCGVHHCKEKCHEGDCMPCLVPVNQKCRCGSSSRLAECYKTMDEKNEYVCEKPCGHKKNCGRHRCNERCCPISSNYTENNSGDWNPHLCKMQCGKKLRCGQHLCQLLCHSGHCPTCPETIFYDLTCACGKSSIPPPLPCGSLHPQCPHPCLVPQPCGHPASHTCHFGDCQPCPFPVAKECIGGHVVLHNIPCGFREIRCNQPCGKTRQCGMHACTRTCHPPPCDSSCDPGSSSISGLNASCGQVCGAPRRDCRHTCTANCHPSAPCPDLKCDFPVTITCSCGRITATVPCGAGGGSSSGFHVDTVFEASVVQKLPVPLHPVEANGKKVPLGQRKLTCDDECAKLERKRVLADAFDITTPNLDALHFGENSSTMVSDLLSDLYRREPKWVAAVEERFKFLVLGKSKGNANSLRVHVFCHMIKEKRDAVRQMAERWKLTTQGAGWEPKRFLVVHVTSKSKPPARILGSKAGTPIIGSQPPVFDPLIDMDPRFVVSLLDMPGDADISALVLRFGGECELVWLNDKNALAVFGDPARAATALRRLDNGSVYHGAVVVLQNGGSSGGNVWGGGGSKEGGVAAKSSNPWKTVVGSAFDTKDGADLALPVWKGNETPIAATINRWSVLDSDGVPNSSMVPESVEVHDPVRRVEGSPTMASRADSSNRVHVPEMLEEVDDWEKAFE